MSNYINYVDNVDKQMLYFKDKEIQDLRDKCSDQSLEIYKLYKELRDKDKIIADKDDMIRFKQQRIKELIEEVNELRYEYELKGRTYFIAGLEERVDIDSKLDKMNEYREKIESFVGKPCTKHNDEILKFLIKEAKQYGITIDVRY